MCMSSLELTVPQLEVACVFLKHNVICERLLLAGNSLPPEAGYFVAEALKVSIRRGRVCNWRAAA